jgi:DNA-directed RNA polymerase omega subunit
MSLPYMDEMLKNLDSKFTLCITAAKRARELADYLYAKKNMERTSVIKPLVDIDSNDPLEISFNELKEAKVSYIRVKDGIK